MLAVALSVVLGLWIVRALNVVLACRLIPHLPEASGSGPPPRLSVIVPARNEEADVAEATRSKVLALSGPQQVVVVDDRSTDGTRAALRALEKESSGRLVVVDGVEPPADWLGKPHAVKQGVDVCAATDPSDWLIFSDADIHFAPDLIARCVAHATREGLDLLTLFPTLEAPTFGERLMAPLIATVGLCYLPGFLMNVTSARSFGGGGGVFILIRRGLYDRIGGHDALKASVADDVQLGRNARKGGGRTAMVLALDSCRVRMYPGFVATLHGFTKNVYFALSGRLPVAALLVALFAAESVLPFAALVVAPPGSLAFTLALATIFFIVVSRGILHTRLRYSLPLVLLHPVFTLLVTYMLARSTFVNGVLGRNVWRGRVRPASGLRL